MAASFETLDQAAAFVVERVKLAQQLGPTTALTRTKLAYTKPESLAQALQFLWNVPEVPRQLGGKMADPVWGTAQKALIGAGLGVGAGGLATMFNEKRRKHMLRNMLLGGLLGGGLGGGLGAMYHTSQARAAGTESTAPLDKLNAVDAQLSEYMRTGQLPPGMTANQLFAARRQLSGEIPTASDYVPPLKDRIEYAWNQLDNGVPGWLDAANTMTPNKEIGALGAGLGVAGGFGTGHMLERGYDKALVNHQNQMKAHEQRLNDRKGMSLQEKVKGFDDGQWQQLFPNNWQKMKQILSRAQPGKERNPRTFGEAFPTVAPRGQFGVDHAQFNQLRQMANQTPDAPKVPHKPFMGRKGWATLGGTIGALAPQFVPGEAPEPPSSAPASPY